jgi:O-antigen ligase
MDYLVQPTLTRGDAFANRSDRTDPASSSRAVRVLSSTIFTSLLVVACLAAIPYGAVEPWWIAVFECVIFLVAILSVLEGFISKSWAWHHLRLAAPIVVLLLFILLQSWPMFSTNTGAVKNAISADPYTTRLFAIKLFALLVTSLALYRLTSSKSRLRALVWVVISIGLASAAFGLLRKNLQQGPGFILPHLPMGDRGFAQFINKNHFAFLMEMSLGVALGLLLGEVGRHRRRLVLIPVVGVLWVALIFSNSRGGIVASLGQLFVLGIFLDPVHYLTKGPAKTAWARFRNLTGGFAVRIFLIVCFVAFFAYGVKWVGGETVVTNFEMSGTDFSNQATYNHSNTSRKDMWSATWRMIKDHPLAGTGFGGYWIAVTKYHNGSGEVTPQQAHNDYLELFASGGLIGAGLSIWFVVLVGKRVRQYLRSRDSFRRAVCLGAVTGILGIAIHSFVDFGLHITINALVCTVLLVIATVPVGFDERQTS